MNYRKGFALAALIAVINAPLSAHAFSAMYVFGDSLSDSGNIHSLVGIPVAPYVDGYFSNGPVWVQTLASRLGLPATTPSNLGGNNYAWGGARISGAGFPSSLVAQQQTYLGDTGGVADPDALYVVWGGGNDVRNNDDANGPTDIGTIISNLAAAGATNFLVPNLPDIGLTPESLAGLAPGGDAALMTALTLAHNTALATQVADLSAADPSLNIVLFDVFSIFNMLVADPAAFGFANANAACYEGLLGTGGPGAVCANPDEYVFWDGIHPTATAHALLGNMAADLVQVVPIPGAIWLMGSALFGLIGLRRRQVG